MIQSFGDKATEDLASGKQSFRTRHLPKEIHRSALRKLQLINRAARLDDLRAPPGNRLEALRGDLQGWHSVRINRQWRIVFRWEDGDAFDVSIADYH